VATAGGLPPVRYAPHFFAPIPLAALIFDLDGTLADTMPYHQEAWDILLAELGIAVDRDAFFRWTAGLTNREIFPRLLDRPLDEEELAHLAQRKEATYRQRYAPHVALVNGAIEFLERAQRRGRRLAVGTAAPPENIALVLDTLRLRARFDAIVGAADVARGKPDPEIFLLAAERLAVPASECVVFEDAPAGIEAARRAGMSCVIVCTTLRCDDILAWPASERAHVRAIVDDFTDPALTALLA